MHRGLAGCSVHSSYTIKAGCYASGVAHAGGVGGRHAPAANHTGVVPSLIAVPEGEYLQQLRNEEGNEGGDEGPACMSGVRGLRACHMAQGSSRELAAYPFLMMPTNPTDVSTKSPGCEGSPGAMKSATKRETAGLAACHEGVTELGSEHQCL